MSFSNIDDMYAAIGYGAITTKQALQRIIDEYKKTVKPDKVDLVIDKVKTKAKPKKKIDRGIKINGIDNILVKFSRCCNPVPGDKIIGYITRGRGVSIHRQDCKNVSEYLNDKDRLLEVEWEKFNDSSYPVEIEVAAYDRVGLLSDIINVIGEMETTIDAVNARASNNGMATVYLVLEINNKQHLENVIQKIKRVNAVYNVRRT